MTPIEQIGQIVSRTLILTLGLGIMVGAIIMAVTQQNAVALAIIAGVLLFWAVKNDYWS